MNEDESFFCAACGLQLSNKPLPSGESQVLKANEFDFSKKEIKHKQIQNRFDSIRFTLSKRDYSTDSKVVQYAILLFGGFSILLGLAILFDEYPNLPSFPSFSSFPSFPPFSGYMMIPIGLTILASVFVFMIARDSNRDPLIFWIIEVLILTFGLTILLPGSSTIIIPIGSALAGLLFVYYLSRHSSRDRTLFIGLAIIVLTFNLGIMIPNSTDIIFPICFILIGLLMCSWALKQNPRTSINTNG